jgi:hypothetical protein
MKESLFGHPPVRNTNKTTISRRDLLKGLFGVAATSAVSGTEGCYLPPDYRKKMTQNIDLSEVQAFDGKRKIIENKPLTSDETVQVINRELAARNLHIDAKELFRFPQVDGEMWTWSGSQDDIRKKLNAHGYRVTSEAAINGHLSVTFEDDTGRSFSVWAIPQVFELCISSRVHDEETDTFELHIPMKPAGANYSIDMYDYTGQQKTPHYRFGFLTDTIVSDDRVFSGLDLSVENGSKKLTSAEEFWRYMQGVENAFLFDTLLLAGLKAYSRFASIEELDRAIRSLPGNDPEDFYIMINRTVHYERDTDPAQEFKHPLQTIQDGWADCDDYAVLSGYWAKRNGFNVQLQFWGASTSGRGNHMTALLTDTKTGTQFFCDNNLIFRAEEVAKKLAYYQQEYQEQVQEDF